jgi:hypothetical protein
MPVQPHARPATATGIAASGSKARLMKASWALGVVALVAGCGGHSGHNVPDAFKEALPHAQVLMDRVDCDPAPDMCTRYVILTPVDTSTTALLEAVTERATHSLRWTPTSAPEVVEPDEGRGYDGPGKTGGYINTASEELHYWDRTGYATASPPNPTLQQAQDLMRAHPDAVVVRIDG